ncbi:hypothetical protein E2C01_075128 [Portunus trituberculatus]|uniref:Uncharacterized protein n=1 Tax=Portunus trituberculatus TaxID=210409 RepID=A0A5B7IIB3_PORTR|nr:hypothetical protein [Portunus trituberculatus]
MSSASSIQGLASPGGTAGGWRGQGDGWRGRRGEVAAAVAVVLVRGSVETKYIIKDLQVVATASLRHRDKGWGRLASWPQNTELAATMRRQAEAGC